ncbi:unnamed protein product [Pneumocystis jirovecii]|uniref:Ubiquinol-cytochrome C reductase hinge domain-containing protein n=1 Tax=Pneumocystis jirovecii TaxID=42068 RepID=L0P725_PNEJI|nr:unnamed protein product [Pneumocystis jirovecii]
MSFPLFVSAEESDYKIESSNNQEDKEKENYNGNDDDSDGDEKDPEDSMPLIQEECLNTKKCALLKHHYDECQKRIISVIEEAEGGKIDNENCVGCIVLILIIITLIYCLIFAFKNLYGLTRFYINC